MRSFRPCINGTSLASKYSRVIEGSLFRLTTMRRAQGNGGRFPSSHGGTDHAVVSYAKKKGVFAGMAVDGSVIAVSDDSNTAYYGKPVRPTDIIVKQSISNPKSTDLRHAAAKFMQ